MENLETEVLEDVEETQEEEVLEEEKKEEPESKESVLKRIKDKIVAYTTGKEKEEEDTQTVTVPEDFSKAAAVLGWSETDVQDFAKDYTEAELKEMIPALLGEDSEKSETSSGTEKETSKETKVKKEEDSQEDERIKKLLDRIEALEKAQGESQEERQEQEIVDSARRASRVFDDTSKDFEVFGKTDELPKFPDGRLIPTSPQMKARNEVWNLAMQLNGKGMDFDNALSVSLNAYKGKNLSQVVKRNVIKDLKKNEQRLSGKRTSHESQAQITNGADIIRAVARKHGRDIV